VTPFHELLADPAFDMLQSLRVVAWDLGRLVRRPEPPTDWLHAIQHNDRAEARDYLEAWERALTLRSEVGSIVAMVALGDCGVQRGRSLLRRACVALRELGVTHEDVQRVIRRRAAESTQPSNQREAS
tara:strand:- start:170 stop:553 length:384 start_codon:yes stop_codon:yes gene_type:complete